MDDALSNLLGAIVALNAVYMFVEGPSGDIDSLTNCTSFCFPASRTLILSEISILRFEGRHRFQEFHRAWHTSAKFEIETPGHWNRDAYLTAHKP